MDYLIMLIFFLSLDLKTRKKNIKMSEDEQQVPGNCDFFIFQIYRN